MMPRIKKDGDKHGDLLLTFAGIQDDLFDGCSCDDGPMWQC